MARVSTGGQEEVLSEGVHRWTVRNNFQRCPPVDGKPAGRAPWGTNSKMSPYLIDTREARPSAPTWRSFFKMEIDGDLISFLVHRGGPSP